MSCRQVNIETFFVNLFLAQLKAIVFNIVGNPAEKVYYYTIHTTGLESLH